VPAHPLALVSSSVSYSTKKRSHTVVDVQDDDDEGKELSSEVKKMLEGFERKLGCHNNEFRAILKFQLLVEFKTYILGFIEDPQIVKGWKDEATTNFLKAHPTCSTPGMFPIAPYELLLTFHLDLSNITLKELYFLV
jgi:hypothetical protein